MLKKAQLRALAWLSHLLWPASLAGNSKATRLHIWCLQRRMRLILGVPVHIEIIRFKRDYEGEHHG